MKTLTKIIAGTAIALALTGCSDSVVCEAEREAKRPKISAVPISVKSAIVGGYEKIVIVFDYNGKPTPALSGWSSTADSTLAEALVQAEIDDKDKEQITLYGQFKGDIFELTAVKANGYEVNFK